MEFSIHSAFMPIVSSSRRFFPVASNDLGDMPVLEKDREEKKTPSRDERKSSPPAFNGRTSALLCHVCSTPGATLHYGGMVCGGCKIFFARAVQKKVYYVCEKNGSCAMAAGKRSRCRSCRFQQCLKAKMCPEEVGKLRELKMPEKLLVKEEGSVVPYFDSAALQSSIIEKKYQLGVSFRDQFKKTTGARNFAQMFINLEKSCDNDSPSSFVPEKYSCSLDVSVAEALRNPLAICERTPLAWRALRRNAPPPDIIKLSYCRLVLHYLDWMGAIDDIYQIDERERLALVSTRICPVLLLTMAFNTYKYKSEEFLLCNGFTYRMQGNPFLSVLNKLVDEIQKKVISRMKELELSEEEYVILKLITLFTMTEPLSCERNAATLRSLRYKYECYLSQLVREVHPQLRCDKQVRRVANLLDLISIVTGLAEIPATAFISVVSLNVANMRGELSYDMHVRKYNV